MAYTTINKSTDYFNTKLYTGDGTTSHAITGVGFEPSMVWCKNRDATNSHFITDQVRGATKVIHPDTNQVEGTWTNGLISFDSDGFTQSNSGAGNENGQGIASWNWLAGTAVSGNTGGSGTAKTYTGSVNTTSGFSIIKYTGNGTLGHTIPHHLGVAPSMMIIKITDGDTSDWYVYHKDLGNTGILFLSNTNAASNSNAYWNSTTPTSSVFTVGDQTGNNSNNNTFISYNFAEVPGFSKFGKYTGNGNVNGTFIYTGFKPSFILRKRTDDVGAWLMQDNKRPGSNRVVADSLPTDQNVLRANETSAEEYNNELDMLSNGFKLRADNSFGNSSGATYIYMAFAEAPLVGSNGVTAKAR